MHRIEPKFSIGDAVISKNFTLDCDNKEMPFPPIKGEIIKTTIYRCGVLYDLLTDQGIQWCPESLLRRIEQ